MEQLGELCPDQLLGLEAEHGLDGGSGGVGQPERRGVNPQFRVHRADRPAYTTVQTIVQRLEQKGAVRRTRKAGNALYFEPAITRKSVYRRLIDELIDLVGGSQPLVAHLVETGKLSLDDLKAIEKAAKRSGK